MELYILKDPTHTCAHTHTCTHAHTHTQTLKKKRDRKSEKNRHTLLCAYVSELMSMSFR
jgi:hypothetical protein